MFNVVGIPVHVDGWWEIHGPCYR